MSSSIHVIRAHTHSIIVCMFTSLVTNAKEITKSHKQFQDSVELKGVSTLYVNSKDRVPKPHH